MRSDSVLFIMHVSSHWLPLLLAPLLVRAKIFTHYITACMMHAAKTWLVTYYNVLFNYNLISDIFVSFFAE